MVSLLAISAEGRRFEPRLGRWMPPLCPVSIQQ